MVENFKFTEEEDGSGLVTMDLSQDEIDHLLERGFIYIMILEMFGIKDDIELINLLEKHKGLDNVVKD